MNTTTTTAPRIRRIIDAEIRSEQYSYFTAERVQEGLYARPGTDARDRAERCYDAAEQGADGTTHREALQDLRDYFRQTLREKARRRPFGADYDRIGAAIDAHIDDLEEWHTTNGTIDQEIG